MASTFFYFRVISGVKRRWNIIVQVSLRSLTCSSRDLASSETNSGMLRVVWRPIPAGWHRSSDYARTDGQTDGRGGVGWKEQTAIKENKENHDGGEG